MLINSTILPQEQQHGAAACTNQPTSHKCARKSNWYFQGPLHLRTGNITPIVPAASLVPPNTVVSHNTETPEPIAHKSKNMSV